MKTHFYLVMLGFTMMACLLSCQKEQALNHETTTVKVPKAIPDGVSEKEGMLVLKDEATLEAMIDYAFVNQKGFIGFESHFSGFTSNRKAYKDFDQSVFERGDVDVAAIADIITIVTEDGEDYVEPTVDAILISYILNDKGMVQVGDHVYKYTYDKVYKFDSEHLPAYLAHRNPNRISEVYAQPIERMVDGHQRVDVAQCDNVYASGRKMSGELSATNALLYCEVKVQTKNRRRGWFNTWFYQDAETLEQRGQVVWALIRLGTHPGVSAVNDFGTNEAEIHEVVFASAAGYIELSSVGGALTHRVKPSGVSLRTCDILH